MRRLSLRTRLALLVLVGVVPFLCFSLGIGYTNYRQSRTEADRRMLDIARGVALAVEGELRSRVAIMELLALSGALRRNDLEAFRAEAEVVRPRFFAGRSLPELPFRWQPLNTTGLTPASGSTPNGPTRTTRKNCEKSRSPSHRQ